MKAHIVPSKILSLVREVRNLIHAARSAAARNINTIQVVTNFEIGRRIFEHEQKGAGRAEYGKKVIRDLSSQLTKDLGQGFSLSNLKLMRQFYLCYQSRIGQKPSGQLRKTGFSSGPLSNDSKIAAVQTLSTKFTLSWSHYVFLLGIHDVAERNFYEVESGQNSWSLPELRRQFNTGLYERLALSRDKAGIRKLAKHGQVVKGAKDLLKEPYVLEFLGLDEKSRYSENDLESAIIDKIEHFLLELGKGFLFEARQKRFTFEDEHYYVDLVFYNRLLHCYVLVDLKIGKLTHQNLGQMQMYVNYFDRSVKLPNENSTIGIILCRKKNDALVEITLPQKTNIRASEYQLYLPSKQVLKQKMLDWIKDEQ